MHSYIYNLSLSIGIFLMKNTSFNQWILTEAYKQSQLVTSHTRDNIPYPFEYEQRAFHYLIDSVVWSNRKLPLYSGECVCLVCVCIYVCTLDTSIMYTTIYIYIYIYSYIGNIPLIRSHFIYMPQCVLNSYSLHPLYLSNKKINRYESQVYI